MKDHFYPFLQMGGGNIKGVKSAFNLPLLRVANCGHM